MTDVIARAPVTAGFKAAVNTALEGSGGDGRDLYVEVGSAPEDSLLNRDDTGRLVDPYGIVYPLWGLDPHGTLANPHRSIGLFHQITCVGWTYQSAQFLADLIRGIVLERGANGVYVHPVDAGLSMVVLQRRISEVGTPELSDGLWQVPDTYVLDVQAL